VNKSSTSFGIPKAGVVIVNYNNFSDTIKYINDYLFKQESIDLEIVVVDNASPNESLKMLENEFSGNEKITIIANNKNSGYAAGNNIGIRFLEKTDCGYIVISNNDIEIDNRMLISELIVKYQSLENVAFISPVMLVNGNISKEYNAWRLPDKIKEIFNSSYTFKLAGYWYIRRFYYNIDFRNSEAIKADCLAGSFFLGSTQIFKEINYLDENTFLYYEENIIGRKVKDLKKQNYLIPDISYAHKPSSTVDNIFSIKEKHKILLNSKIYFWEHYCNAGIIFINLLKIGFLIYSIEHFFLLPYHKLKEYFLLRSDSGK
jgi:GT2 family glycosyltransferase